MRDITAFIAILAFVGYVFYSFVVRMGEHQEFCKANPTHNKCIKKEDKDDTCIFTDSCVVDIMIINEIMY